MMCLSRRSVSLFTAAVAVLVFQQSTSADHAWRKYHWARTANPFNLVLAKTLSTSNWSTALSGASTDWSQSSVLNTSVVNGSNNRSQCNPTSGRVEVCNHTYGSTGWLGVAQIWIVRGTHIVQGTVKVNDTYFNMAQYNTSAWRQMVMCQEVGHTFGLDHQDENFTNPNLGTCMDYTNDPTSNQHPNAHDYEELEIIYSHLDSFTTVGGGAATLPGASFNEPSEWGQLMKVSHGGKTQIFERELGNGLRLVTFVIWA